MEGTQIDQWLGSGGLILAASERAARALLLAYHQRRRAEALTAWPTPAIHTWSGFVRSAWEARCAGDRMLLSAAQEQALWSGILARETHLTTLLAGPRHRLAAMAMEAHALLCGYAPRYLRQQARVGWDRDAGAFSAWLSSFDAACQKARAVSPARAPLELLTRLQADASSRPPLLLAGFDRLLPVQRELVRAWGTEHELEHGEPAEEIRFYAAPDEAAEWGACAAWCMERLAANPQARLLIVAQQAGQHRGELERAFLRASAPEAKPLFEFSLGIPLAQAPLARAASLVLRWLEGALQEHELDWLLSTDFSAADMPETRALQARMRALRAAGLARPAWTWTAFTTQATHTAPLPDAWLQRMQRARQLLAATRSRPQSPPEWAALVPQLLHAAGFPGKRLSSAEHQAWQRWQQALDTAASLGFDGRRIAWTEFLADLARILAELLYAPESASAPIQITGAAESAGLTADAIWFLGATEESWPAAAAAHPLLPLAVQREHGMPHATPQLDWQLAQSITTRLTASAPLVCFSYARRENGVETRPSRLAMEVAGSPQPLPDELAPHRLPQPCTEEYADTSSIPFPHASVPGGAAVLSAQSQCAFKAFAQARLRARSWEPAEFGLTAQQRGLLLHAVLHTVWSGKPDGLGSRADLLALPDREGFVAAHVERAMREKLNRAVRERMPQRYLALESTRLTRLVTEWLGYEAARVDFTVEKTEAPGEAAVAGLMVSLRLDRIDRLADGSLAVIDYKTGNVSAKSWELPRPEDVQLPLYAGYALHEEPGGLLFARLRAGQSRFEGQVRDAEATLFPRLHAGSTLMRRPLTEEQMRMWREAIAQLARDFVIGRAEAGPREYPETCERCGLYALCRIQESRLASATDESGEGEDGD